MGIAVVRVRLRCWVGRADEICQSVRGAFWKQEFPLMVAWAFGP